MENGSTKLKFLLITGYSCFRYGRLLAHVYVDGQTVQVTLLKEGLARVLYIINPPFRYLDLFRG
ncbi:thermonuclease family protein [Neobacillus drentensis]|uniref:thermonuclease family protein n=1 Tax=Neobacillus drentensis TaxID=220684 RepID=UPI002FFE64C1